MFLKYFIYDLLFSLFSPCGDPITQLWLFLQFSCLFFSCFPSCCLFILLSDKLSQFLSHKSLDFHLILDIFNFSEFMFFSLKTFLRNLVLVVLFKVLSSLSEDIRDTHFGSLFSALMNCSLQVPFFYLFPCSIFSTLEAFFSQMSDNPWLSIHN